MQDTISFLNDLQVNNNREWFHGNKARYDANKQNFETLVTEILKGVMSFEQWGPTEPKSCIFRINRDVRFSTNKSPYKNYFSAAFGDGGRHSEKVDFYLHLQPDNIFMGGGMWAPTPPQLQAYRQEIDYNAIALRNILNEKTFKAFYHKIEGESLKKAPKGYSIEHPDLDLLARKQLFVMHQFSNEEALHPDFAQKVIDGCKIMRPFKQFFNQLFFENND